MDYYKALFEYELERSKEVARAIGKVNAKLLIARAIIATSTPDTCADKLKEVDGLIKEAEDLLK